MVLMVKKGDADWIEFPGHRRPLQASQSWNESIVLWMSTYQFSHARGKFMVSHASKKSPSYKLETRSNIL
jgi:hypothetical protein